MAFKVIDTYRHPETKELVQPGTEYAPHSREHTEYLLKAKCLAQAPDGPKSAKKEEKAEGEKSK